MAGEVAATQSATAFEFELVDADTDLLTTVIAKPGRISPWIEPSTLKLRHRIGRGPFGDVWLATQHRSTHDYDEYHEVAVKMLHQMKEDHTKVVLDKFANLFRRCQGLAGICSLHGVSVISGKICIVMKFYEGSIGDKMALRRGGNISLPDILRYGVDLARAVLVLHSRHILVLNLKPCNFLVNHEGRAILGDVGVPFLLLQVPLPSSDKTQRLGTPNYMAPEQWHPEVAGPVSFETDSWGFGCSIVEMLSGVQPWCGKSVEEIHDLVFRKQRKPLLPSGLPPAVENVISGCFAYDSRSRPSMANILDAFKSSENAVYGEGGWSGLASRAITEKFIVNGYTEWFLSKERFQVGDTVRSRKPPNSCKPENMDVPEGTIVGLERDSDQDDYVLVRVHGIHDPLRVHRYTLERVTSGLAAGDWVRLKEEDKKNSPVGILHCIRRDGSVDVGFIGRETLWKGSSSELHMAESYCVGQFVRLRANVLSPRFQWPRRGGGAWATGRIWHVFANGCLVVKFPGRLPTEDERDSFFADPAEVEVVSFETCPGIVEKYQHLEDFHWAVRPLLVALGLFAVMKLGSFVGKNAGKSKVKIRLSASTQNEDQQSDDQTAGNPAWFPLSVGLIFNERVPAANSQ